MKTRFSTVDLATCIREIREGLISLRVANVYDVDNRTYLIKLARPDEKAMILIESGNRIHKTEFEWPKNAFPSGFSMKLRKHLRARRLEKITQLGVDRIVDLQFGSGDAAYHVIVELYDRGNIVLTDYEYLILNILRPRTDESQEVRFAVREKYPLELAKPYTSVSQESLQTIVNEAKDGELLKRVLNPHLPFGLAVIEHSLLSAGINDNVKLGGANFDRVRDMNKLTEAMSIADDMMRSFTDSPTKGYIIQKMEKKATVLPGEATHIVTYTEFHPFLFKQHEKLPYVEFPAFTPAVDEFYSKLNSQKLDMKVLQQEKGALKKLENVRKDHEKRLDALQREQTLDVYRAELIEMNLDLVDKAITIVRSFIANQISWSDLGDIIKEAKLQGDPVAAAIKDLKLATNHIVLVLSGSVDDDDVDANSFRRIYGASQKVEIDLGTSAYANATKYYDLKRHASSKEQKTIDASKKALKSAQRKTHQTLKDVATAATINKARKTYWFEKFLWFISSENYLVVAGRDQQQNEMIWKRYLKSGDVYVHADLHGACSVVIKNKSKAPVGPKTLTEAGVMAVCHSTAWDARIVTSAWWVHPEQVSKTAPSGEYLTTGSFMIRGKKNYLPPCHLVYGFGFMFKVDDDSILRHRGERKLRVKEEEGEESGLPGDTANKASNADDAAIEGSRAGGAAEERRRAGGAAEEGRRAGGAAEEGSRVDGAAEEGTRGESGDAADDCEEFADLVIEPGSDSDDDLCTDTAPDDAEVDPAVRPSHRNTDTDANNISSVENAEPGGEECDSDGDEIEDADSDALGVNDNLVETKVQDDDDADNTRTEAEAELSFPDTEIAVQYLGGDQFHLETRIPDAGITPTAASPISVDSSNKLSRKQRRDEKKTKRGQSATDHADDNTSQVSCEDGERKKLYPQQVTLKRGQKAKMKKIKEKYADQDDEERQLKMKILMSAGEKKEDKKVAKIQKVKQAPSAANKWRQARTVKTQILQDDSAEPVPVEGKEADADSDEEKQSLMEEENLLTESGDVLDTLTGCPVAEDTLLFAVPVCAPYSTMTNYKFKVKLTPGTTKRGKASKAAFNIFLCDKSVTNREKDLLRAVKDVDLSRNFPGKVKVSAPNLHNQKRR